MNSSHVSFTVIHLKNIDYLSFFELHLIINILQDLVKNKVTNMPETSVLELI